MLYRFGMLVCRVILAFLRVRRSATGLENIPGEGGAILAMTHFGYFEFGLIVYSIWRYDRRRVRFLITSGAFHNPVIGFLLRRLRQIPVDRHAGESAFDAAKQALAEGSLIGIFPEAGIDPSFTVRALKTGTVRLAKESGAPVIPVAVWGGQRLLTREHKFERGERFGNPVRLIFGPEFPVDGEPHEATDRLRSTLQALVATLQADYPDDGKGQWWHPASLGGTAPTPEEAAELDAAVVARRDAKLAARSAKRRG